MKRKNKLIDLRIAKKSHLKKYNNFETGIINFFKFLIVINLKKR